MLYCTCPQGLCALGPCAVGAICHQKSNYSLPDAIGNCDGDVTRDEPACSTEEEGTMKEEDEEGSPGRSNVALGQHSTAGRYQHYTLTQNKIGTKKRSAFVTQSCLQLV